MSRGNRSRKLDITVGQCLAVLLWLLVLAASEPSRVFYASFAFSAVDPSPSGAGGASSAAANYQQSAAVRDFEHSLARVQPLLERYGYGAVMWIWRGAS